LPVDQPPTGFHGRDRQHDRKPGPIAAEPRRACRRAPWIEFLLARLQQKESHLRGDGCDAGCVLDLVELVGPFLTTLEPGQHEQQR